ncbi:MAG: hypothetical protein EOO39_50625, partial [Cytophagaceae bacterium]
MKHIGYLLLLSVVCGYTTQAQTPTSPQSTTLPTSPQPITSSPTAIDTVAPTTRPTATAATSQTGVTVSGVVTDAKSEPLPGVTVQLKGVARGTTTNIDGTFQLSVPDRQTVLVFSYTGFAPQEIVVGNQTTITVKLGEDTQTLNEVVVVGYGTQ